MTTPPRLSWLWRLIAAAARFVVRGVERWRIDVRGLEHVPTEGGAVLAFNHHSYFDFVMVAWSVVIQMRRPVRFLAKREIWNSWARPIVRAAGAVPVDRGDTTSRHGAYAAAVQALQRGELVAVAPEQTVSLSFELLPFRTGAVRMAQAAGVPIIPVVGWGTQRFAAKGFGIRHAPGIPVLVRYLEPIHVPPDAEPVAVTAELQARMAATLREVQDAYPVAPEDRGAHWQPARLGGAAPDHETVLAEHQRRFEERQRRTEG